MALTTTPYDSADNLRDMESIQVYLDDALESGDPAIITHALGVVARAKGMAGVARQAGLSRESLYKALSGEGNPEFATVLKVVEALGLRLTIVAIDEAA